MIITINISESTEMNKCSCTHTQVFRISGSHSGGYEEFFILGYNALQAVQCQPTFWRNMSPPSSRSKNKPSKKSA
jgi:hypothetical protein